VNVRAVADLAELRLSPASAKSGSTHICSEGTPCEATVRFRLVDTSLVDAIVCAALTGSGPGSALGMVCGSAEIHGGVCVWGGGGAQVMWAMQGTV
jgi:hypothetical protein